MKTSRIAAIAFGATVAAFTAHAGAAPTSGTVCGRVNAPTSYILALEQSPNHDNIIVARSNRNTVSTHVNVDGSFCFTGLAPELYTLTAFPQAFSSYQTIVMPVAGKMLNVQVDRRDGF